MSRRSRYPRRVGREELRERSTGCQQRRGWTALDEMRPIQDQNPIGAPGELEAVGDQERRATPHDRLVPGDDLALRRRVERRGRLVEHQDTRVSKQRAGDREALVAAIDWAGANDVALVNLSLGTREPAHAGPLRDAVSRLSGRTVVIAAGTHDGVAWLPGTLDGVLGVELDWSCPRGSYEIGGTVTAPRLRTSGYPRPIPGVDPERNLKGLSFAVASMTGLAARAVADTGVRGYDALISQLVRRAC